MQPPASPVAALANLVSLGLSYLISTLIALLLGLIAFWTFEIQGVLGFGRIQQLDWIIRQGEFDRYLIRPLSPFLQLVTERVWVSAFGDLLGGVVLFAAATSLVGVNWSPAALGYLVLAMIGGCFLEASLKLCVAALAFRFLQTGNLVFFVDQVFNNFGNYPLKIFSGTVEFLLTFAFPLAFVAYFPATCCWIERESSV